MLMSQSRVLCMFLECIQGAKGQRADCNSTSHEEENFVHGDSQPNAYANQQRYSRTINASVVSFDCSHDFSFR
jgi:hypothetical protein